MNRRRGCSCTKPATPGVGIVSSWSAGQQSGPDYAVSRDHTVASSMRFKCGLELGSDLNFQ
uniref:Uncharacterized protein n=1 Tax=Arundo donax TaxID=35708 RepID=A0A0A9CKE2_ARUDO